MLKCVQVLILKSVFFLKVGSMIELNDLFSWKAKYALDNQSNEAYYILWFLAMHYITKFVNSLSCITWIMITMADTCRILSL